MLKPIVLLALFLLTAHAHAARIERISAHERTLVVSTSGVGERARLLELRPYESHSPGDDRPVLWRGRIGAEPVTIPRFQGARDRLYSRLQLAASDTGEPVGAPHHVDDLSGLAAWDHHIPWPESIKGVTCPVDIPDLSDLGVKHIDTNVLLSALLDWPDADPEESWQVDGHTVGINMGYVRALDAQIKPMTDAGINVILIILNGVPAEPDPDNPLIHPRTDLANAPNHLGAFNVTDAPGVRHLRAAMEYLAHRYSAPSAEHGRVSGYIMGNELQSHYQWHNQGHATLPEVVDHYATALRIAWLAVRRYHTGTRVYVSLDHNWAHAGHPDPGRACRGDLFLERLSQTVTAAGDFPWHVAFHPYPENLFEPRFWLDRAAVMGFDTPRLTFKNLEVLPAFLRQERFLYRGHPRRIILSEQGFHCPAGEEGEKLQAAAYAYAYHKTRHMAGIDALILHRHVDHRAEHGLRLGLWARDPDGDHPSSPGTRRLIWDVFRLADTDQWRAAFEFALPVAGLESWDDALPADDPVPQVSGTIGSLAPEGAIVYDLHAHMRDAEGAKGMAWRSDWHVGPGGKLYPTIFQHPPGPGAQGGEAIFTIRLPQARAGRALLLRFGTAVGHPDGDGVGFAVWVDGEQAWSTRQAAGTSDLHSLDLTRFAGRSVKLSLRVDRLGHASYDWAHWLHPVITWQLA